MQVELQKLLKAFGPKVAVDVPALSIGAGQTFGLVGSNGAGKTTFLRLLLDLLRPDRGSVQIENQTVGKDIGWKMRTGSYLDESFLIGFLTADEYLMFVGNMYGMKPDLTKSMLLPYQPFYSEETFGKTTRLIRDMSRGNAKKIGLVAAMIARPRLLILDEPFANLDPGSQIRLKTYLRGLNRSEGTTVIVSSHDLMHVTDVCERIAILEDGRIVRDISTSQQTLLDLQQYFSFE